jgi:transaldolase
MAAVRELYRRVLRPNILITIPGIRENLSVIEEAIFLGVPVNATLLFSRQHYLAAAEAFIRGIERRIAAGLSPKVGSVASLFISPWDASVEDMVPDTLYNQLGTAIAGQIYSTYKQLQRSQRWQRARNAGAQFQRLLWAGTSTHVQKTADPFYYIKSLAAPGTINTITENGLEGLINSGGIGVLMPFGRDDYQEVFSRFAEAGVDIDSLAIRLQNEAVASLIKMRIELLMAIAAKSAALV